MSRKPILSQEQIDKLPSGQQARFKSMADDYEALLDELDDAVASKDQKKIEQVSKLVQEFKVKYNKK